MTTNSHHNNLQAAAERLLIRNLMTKFISTADNHNADNFIKFCSENITQEDIKNASSLTQNREKSLLWKKLRSGRITASKLYEASVCRTPSGSLVKQIIDGSGTFTSGPMERGLLLEELVLKELEKDLHTQIQPCGFTILKDAGIFGASPDGITDDAVIEVVCPDSEKTFSNYINPDKREHKKCLAQINLQMRAENLNKGVLCIAHPDFETSKKFEKVLVDYNSELTEELMERAMQFWKENVFPKLYADVKYPNHI